MFEHLMENLITYIIHLLEGMGVFVITFTAIKDFFEYAKRAFNFSDDTIKIELAKSLALGLEFKLAAEILKTVTVRTLDEIYILAAIVVLRVILTYVLHWEIKSDTEHCNEFAKLKEKLSKKCGCTTENEQE